jgi:hypothetical protein
MQNKKIEVLASQTQTQVLEGQCAIAENHFDSIKEAKARVKYVMSKQYQNVAEMSEPIRYAQIVVNGECLYDYFAKGYNGEEDK